MYDYHEINIRYILTYNRGPMWKWHWWMHFQSMSPWWCVYWWPKHLHMHVWSRLQRSALWAWTGWMYQLPMSQQRHMSWYGRDVHVWMSGWKFVILFYVIGQLLFNLATLSINIGRVVLVMLIYFMNGLTLSKYHQDFMSYIHVCVWHWFLNLTQNP